MTLSLIVHFHKIPTNFFFFFGVFQFPLCTSYNSGGSEMTQEKTEAPLQACRQHRINKNKKDGEPEKLEY